MKAGAGTPESGGMGLVGTWRCQRQQGWGCTQPGRRQADLGRNQHVDSFRWRDPGPPPLGDASKPPSGPSRAATQPGGDRELSLG